MGQNARLRPLGLGCCVLGVMAVPGCFELRPDRLEISVHEDYAGAITKELLPPRFNGGFGFPGSAFRILDIFDAVFTKVSLRFA